MSHQFIYFDLGNVLLYFDHEVSRNQMAEVAGVDPELIQQVVFDSGLQWQYERGEISCDEFVAKIINGTKPAEPPTSDELLLAASAIFEVNVSVLPIVAHLKAVGNRLGILSNTCAAHWKYVTGRYRFVNDLFDEYALSFELKHMKPEAEIYPKAAETVGVDPSEILFIDDRPENIEAARDAGFDAIPFTTSNELDAELRERQLRYNF